MTIRGLVVLVLAIAGTIAALYGFLFDDTVLLWAGAIALAVAGALSWLNTRVDARR